MEFTKIISSPVFAASAPDIGLEAQSASPVKIVVTTPSASWDITLSPVSDADGKNLLNIRLRDILSAVASAPDPSETEPNSAIPLLMVNLSASNTEGEQASMDIPVAFGTLNGKDPKDFTGQWLTSREQICLTYSWARERLSLIFGPQLLRWSGSVSLTVNCRAYYASGKARNFQLVSAGSSDTVYYSVDCSYSAISALDDSGEQLVAWDLSYTLSGINADGESDSVDSFPQRFILANQDGRIREYIFANCFGMEDRVFGEGVARREVSGSSSTFVNGGKTLEVSNDAEIVYEAFSGQLADRRAVFHWYDFLSSSTRLIFSTADGSMTHIVVESHDSETEDFSVAGVSFSYRLSEKNGVYPDGLCGTIGDYDPNQQCGALWVGDDPQAVTPAEEDLFFLKHRLSEFQTLTVSDALLLLVQSPATDAWGSVSLGSIKSWIKKFLDGESREIRLNSLADYETADGKVIDPAKLQNGSIPVWDAAAGAYHPVPASELGDYGINPKLYPLVFQKGKDVVLTYAPNVGKAVLDISDFASAETLSTHISDKDIHVTAEQKSAWDRVASLFGVNEEGNIYIKDDRGLISYSFISARGSDPEAGSGGGGSGVDMESVWYALAQPTSEKINVSHLSANNVAQLLTAAGYKLTDTTYGLATDTVSGLIKTGYAENGKNYAVKLDGTGAAYVTVNWQDKFDTYFGVDGDGNIYVKDNRGLWSNSFLSARGSDPEAGSGGGAGIDMTSVWFALGQPTDEKINASHIPAIGMDKVSGLADALAGKLDSITKPMVEAVLTGTITSHNHDGRYAPLSGGLIPSQYLPSYVDDVLEYASKTAFPATGEAGKIYVALDTNLTYRWGGSAYVEISPSLALGHTSSTAYPGDEGAALAALVEGMKEITDLFGIDEGGNVYVKDGRGFYGTSFVSARGSDPGAGSGGGSGVDMESVWYALAQPTTDKINVSHIPALQQLSGTLTNAQLANSSITVAGVEVPLGSAVTTAQIASALTAAGYKLTDTTYTLSSFGITATASELNKLDGLATTAKELGYVHGVTSNIQTQLNGKANTSALSAYLPLAGGTMSGTLTFPTATQAYDSLGVRFSGVSSRIGASAAGGLGLYAQDAIYLRPNWTSGGTLYGLVVSASDLTYNGNPLLHSGNYTNYTVTKTGGGASGLWGISISGIANRAVYLTSTYTGSGGLQPPSYFNGMGLKVNMMNKPVSYCDVIVVNGYGGQGSDVPYINALAFQKTANAHGEVYHARGDYGGSSWGTWYKFLDEYNYAGILDSRYLQKSSYTASDILAKLKTVDGSGSGLDADLLDGYHGSSSNTTYTYVLRNSKAGALVNEITFPLVNFPKDDPPRANISPMSLRVWDSYNQSVIGGDTYGTVLEFCARYSHWNHQLYFQAFGHNIWHRASSYNDSSWTYGWVKLATVNDNVASATKLATARSIWGQPFDGRQNVNGYIYLDSQSHRIFFGTSGTTVYLSAGDGYFTINKATDTSYAANLLRINLSNGAVGINAVPSAMLHVGGNGYFSSNLEVSGTIHSSVGIWSDGYVSAKGQDTTSDARYKRDVAALPAQAALAVLMRLRPSTWAWKDDGRRGAGFVAQEVMGVLPEAVREVGDGEDRHLALNYQMLHAYEVCLLQTHETELERLRGRVLLLENEIKRIRYGS